MNGFKPTGYGPSAGFKFPASFGFTGSTGAYTQVSPYMRQKPRAFKDGGYVSEKAGDPGHALVPRNRPYTNEDQQAGGRSPLRRGFKDGGKNWIKGAIKHPGALHKALGVPAGEKIPAKKLNKAAHSDNPTMRRRANLAKTLKKMHKADGGKVSRAREREIDIEYLRRNALGLARDRDYAAQDLKANSYPFTPPGVYNFYKQRADEARKRFDEYKAPALDESWRHKAHPTPKKLPTAGSIKAKFAAADGGPIYGSSSKGFRSDLRKTGEFIGQIPRLVTDAMRGSMRRAQEDVARDKRRRIDRIAEGTASNYARGGKMKRMGYADGGKMKRMGYADGGNVSRAEAKRIAERTIGEHVRYPAPKGHKGLGAMCK